MDLMQDLYLNDVLQAVAQALLVPVAVLLLAAILYALYSLGTLIVEALTERRRYRAIVPELVARVEIADYPGIASVVEESGLLRSQKDDLEELAAYLWLPEDGRTEVARRLISTWRDRLMLPVQRCEFMAKAAPMLGLMGTLIPLGPGLMALSTGDTETLSSSLRIAFNTTTAGLAVSLVCFFVAHLRRRWYRDYLVSTESLMNAVLERGRILHAEGYEFPRNIYEYDAHGARAKKSPVQAGRETDSSFPLRPEGKES